jgi:hypothetical protein
MTERLKRIRAVLDNREPFAQFLNTRVAITVGLGDGVIMRPDLSNVGAQCLDVS